MDIIENDIQTIGFRLGKTNGKEELTTLLADVSYSIDFTSEDQSSLKDLFVAILKQLESGKFHFSLETDPDFKNELFIGVANDYIAMLNKEIDSVFCEMSAIKKKANLASQSDGILQNKAVQIDK